MVSAAPGPAAAPPVTQKREFWVLMGYAVVLGVFGAFAGLVFIGVIKFGGKWYSDSHPGWLGGHWWWVAVAAAAGAVVGLLRRLTRLPQEVPGLFEELQTEHVDRDVTHDVPGEHPRPDAPAGEGVEVRAHRRFGPRAARDVAERSGIELLLRCALPVVRRDRPLRRGRRR